MVFQYKICRYLLIHEITAYVEQGIRYLVLFHGNNTISVLLYVRSDCATCSLGNPDCKIFTGFKRKDLSQTYDPELKSVSSYISSCNI